MNITPQVRGLDAILKEGVANVRAGKPHLGVLGVSSPLGQEFDAAYETWMTLRARAGDRFALSLGYGRNHV